MEMRQTEKVIEDALRLDKEWKYKKASNNLATIQRAIASDEKTRAKHAAQLKVIDKLEALAATLDNKIEGKGGFLAREAILNLLGYAHTDQQRRHDEAEKRRTMLTKELPRMEQEVEKFQ
jgi:hypothetical protein